MLINFVFEGVFFTPTSHFQFYFVILEAIKAIKYTI
jgi:hypothetical protein